MLTDAGKDPAYLQAQLLCQEPALGCEKPQSGG